MLNTGHFSAENRGQILRDMQNAELDLLVIGGGITGAGIAWDASVRGMATGLLEMGDFAWGTSSRSTKLVHGGLRYLKQGEVKLVMEVGRERALLHKRAPHIVVPAPMLLPIYKGGTYGYWASSIGLYVYDLLAGVKRSERRKIYNKHKTMQLEPLFKTEGLKGAGYYYEYRTDDARLTMEIMKSAHQGGAKIINYTKAVDFIYQNGHVAGVRAQDMLSGGTVEIYAHKIVNAAGPWVDRVREMDGSKQGKKLLLTKGVHLVIDYEKLPVKQAAYFDVPDGRMIFVIPREGKTYVGTTDTVYKGDIEEPRTLQNDRDYLLDAVNAAFPSVQLAAEDVESCWAGLRPLIYEEGKGTSEISRKDEIFISDSGLITIAGGKLTGFRKMAEKVVDLTAKQLNQEHGRTFPPCSTDRQPISGGDSGRFDSFEALREHLIQEGEIKGISRTWMDYLLNLYGSNVVQILRYFDTMGAEGDAEARIVKAEVEYCMEHEMTVHAVDYFVRRTGMLYFDRFRLEKMLDSIVGIMAEQRGWDKAEQQRQKQAVLVELQHVTVLPAKQEGR